VRLRETLRFAARFKSAIVSRTPDGWFISLTGVSDHVVPAAISQKVGRLDQCTAFLALIIARSERGRAGRLHARIAHVGREVLPKLTTSLVDCFKVVGISDLYSTCLA
jgi:hypothetical protein